VQRPQTAGSLDASNLLFTTSAPTSIPTQEAPALAAHGTRQTGLFPPSLFLFKKPCTWIGSDPGCCFASGASHQEQERGWSRRHRFCSCTLHHGAVSSCELFHVFSSAQAFVPEPSDEWCVLSGNIEVSRQPSGPPTPVLVPGVHTPPSSSFLSSPASVSLCLCAGTQSAENRCPPVCRSESKTERSQTGHFAKADPPTVRNGGVPFPAREPLAGYFPFFLAPPLGEPSLISQPSIVHRSRLWRPVPTAAVVAQSTRHRRISLQQPACSRWRVAIACIVGSMPFHVLRVGPTRCVSHKEKFLVVSHKGTVFFPCGIFRKSKISH